MALLMVAAPGQPCACGLSSLWGGREILSGLRWRALMRGAGGLISPSGSCGGMPGTASPAPR
jgi:hypothetical protein